MILTIDTETTFQIGEKGKLDPSPFHPDNRLVSVGINDEYWFLYHHHMTDDALRSYANDRRDEIQDLLNKATLIIGHNIKFDLLWLLEAGFRIPDCPLWDTMICDYVMARGQKPGLSLDACLERRGLELKNPVIDEYINKKISFESIPMDIVELYGRQDVRVTRNLYDSQQEELKAPGEKGLLSTILMMNKFLKIVIEMERNGTFIDKKALDELETNTRLRLQKLEHELQTGVTHLMGDTKINLESPEDLSKVLYSRVVQNKKTWAEKFNIGSEQRGAVTKRKRPPRISDTTFIGTVRAHTSILHKTKAEQCQACTGAGRVSPKLKNGKPGKAIRICLPCDGQGYILVPQKEVAGLKIVPPNVNFVSAGGFQTDSDTLKKLLPVVRDPIGKKFLEGLIEINSVGSYLNNFVLPIKNNIRVDGCVHAQFRQTVTATGRLSSSNPNWQNLPRGNTFPIRGVLRSRWEDGCLLEWDAAQLEFRVAVELADCEQGMQDIADKVDVHTNTANALTAAGQPTNRQDAKPHTFKPLYGGTSGTPAEQAYYSWFLNRYRGIDAWQKKLQSQAIHPGIIQLPSGREYKFLNVKRMYNGSVTYSTQIKNYPVQGYATGDIVPMLTIAVWNRMKRYGFQSLLINEVHDSNIIDVYPGELDDLIKCTKATLGMWQDILSRYGLPIFKVPLAFEIKTGKNLLSMKEV